MGVAFRVYSPPWFGPGDCCLPPPASQFSRLRPSPLTRFLLLPTTLFSWMCPVPSRLFPADLPPPTFCCQEKLVTKNKTTGRRGGRGRKVVPGGLSLPGFDPFDVQGVPPPGVRGCVGGRAERAPSGWPLPSAGRVREAVEVPQSPPGARRSRCSPHPKPAQAAAPKCFLSALKQNPEGASFLPTSPRLTLPARRRLEEMNGPGPSWVRRTLPHPRCD